MLRLLASFPLVAALLCGQTAILPLADVKPGMKGIGRTVFQGFRSETFNVDILGVLEGVGPKQSIILARLSGGPLEQTGVLQGMSGSPVYVEGRLMGAVALAFQFAKEPIAGIRPVEEMLKAASGVAPAAVARTEVLAGEARLTEIATPLHLSGFTRAALEHFAPSLRQMGLAPQQGAAGSSRIPDRIGDLSKLQPGSMISVQMMTGDMSVGADGTVTLIDGNRVYAFGHRLTSAGSTEMPFALAEVLTLLPNMANSFKISAAREWMGTITDDRNAAIAGVTGRRPALVPVTLNVRGSGATASETYHMQMINHRVFSPLLLQMAVFSALDATERAAGGSAIAVRGILEFEGAPEPVRLDNAYAGDLALPAFASLSAALPLTWAYQNSSDLRLKSVNLTLEAEEQRRFRQIDQVWASARSARPGQTIEIRALLTGSGGVESVERVSYQIPRGELPGPLYFTVSDAPSLNVAEMAPLAGTAQRPLTEIVSMLNRQRGNRRAYLRVWRSEPGFLIPGGELAGPPASIALLLQKTPLATASYRGTTLAEIPLGAADSVVTGSKTIQVDIKE